MSPINKLLAAISVSVASLSAFAAPAPPPPPPDCTLDSFTITSATVSGTSLTQNFAPSIQATSCYGLIVGNDESGGTLDPNPNLGWLNDGLLNGQDGKVSPTQFITPDQLQALEDPTKAVDPGWIMLAYGNGSSVDITYNDRPFDLSEVLEIKFNANGTWTLSTVANIVEILEQKLPNRTYFDHLAFTIKSSTFWAIYDFDFNQFPGFDLNQPYSFTGTWNTDDFDGKDVSHLSVWARDPIITNDVPLPGTLMLIGAGLVALGFSRRKA
jgi:hypothetical protein